MTSAEGRAVEVSVRQFVADSGSVTRGLRHGRTYTLILDGEPLARMIPIGHLQGAPKTEVVLSSPASPLSTPMS